MSTTTHLYRIYGPNRRLLYVGITGNVDRRLSQHSEKAWWSEVRAIDTQEYATRQDAVKAEAAAIRDEAPVYNRAGAAKPKQRATLPRVNSTTRKTLVSLAQAAEYADVHPRTLRRRIADGTLRAYRVGRLVKVDMHDVETLLVPIGGVR